MFDIEFDQRQKVLLVAFSGRFTTDDPWALDRRLREQVRFLR